MEGLKINKWKKINEIKIKIKNEFKVNKRWK